MKTVEITSDFDGYPNGRDKRRFVTGEEHELSNDYADLIVGKGLAREKPGGGKPAAPPITQKPAAEGGKTEDSK